MFVSLYVLLSGGFCKSQILWEGYCHIAYLILLKILDIFISYKIIIRGLLYVNAKLSFKLKTKVSYQMESNKHLYVYQQYIILKFNFSSQKFTLYMYVTKAHIFLTSVLLYNQFRVYIHYTFIFWGLYSTLFLMYRVSPCVMFVSACIYAHYVNISPLLSLSRSPSLSHTHSRSLSLSLALQHKLMM